MSGDPTHLIVIRLPGENWSTDHPCFSIQEALSAANTFKSIRPASVITIFAIGGEPLERKQLLFLGENATLSDVIRQCVIEDGGVQ